MADGPVPRTLDGSDGDIHVETIDENLGHAGPGPEAESKMGFSVQDALGSTLEFVQGNGWVLLVLGIGVWYGWGKLEAWLRKRRAQQQDGLHARDPDRLLEQQLRREERIRQLQEEQDRSAAAELERQREREEQKRKEKLEDWDAFQAGKGYKAKSRHQANGTAESDAVVDAAASAPRPRRPPMRDNDYSPLSGGGGSSGYRPAPRGGGFGGG